MLLCACTCGFGRGRATPVALPQRPLPEMEDQEVQAEGSVQPSERQEGADACVRGHAHGALQEGRARAERHSPLQHLARRARQDRVSGGGHPPRRKLSAPVTAAVCWELFSAL